MQYDVHRGYNSYIISRNGRRIIYGSDTAITDAFAKLRDGDRYDLAIMGIGAYDPWIWAHSTPEQAVNMADATFTLNFSTGASMVLAQYYNFVRFGHEGYRYIMETMQTNARELAEPQQHAIRRQNRDLGHLLETRPLSRVEHHPHVPAAAAGWPEGRAPRTCSAGRR